MSRNTKQLKLSKNKKKTKKKLVPFVVSGLVVLGGIVTLVQNLDGSLPSRCYSNGCAKKEIVLELPKSQSNMKQKLELEKAEGRLSVPHTISPMIDVELENSRLLIQRDIQRLINHSTAKRKPFNYGEEDRCILELKYRKDKVPKLLIKKCSNHVFRRSVKLSLDSFEHDKLVSKYNFKTYSPQIEVRLHK